MGVKGRMVLGKKREVGNSGGGDQEGDQKSMVLKDGKDGTGKKRILSDKIWKRQERYEAISLYSTCTKREENELIRIRILGSLVCFLIFFYALQLDHPLPLLVFGLSSVSRRVDGIHCLMASFAMELICAVSFRDLLDP